MIYSVPADVANNNEMKISMKFDNEIQLLFCISSTAMQLTSTLIARKVSMQMVLWHFHNEFGGNSA